MSVCVCACVSVCVCVCAPGVCELYYVQSVKICFSFQKFFFKSFIICGLIFKKMLTYELLVWLAWFTRLHRAVMELREFWGSGLNQIHEVRRKCIISARISAFACMYLAERVSFIHVEATLHAHACLPLQFPKNKPTCMTLDCKHKHIHTGTSDVTMLHIYISYRLFMHSFLVHIKMVLTI